MNRTTWTAAYVALVLVVAAVAWARPLFGWDMLGYVGATLALDEHDPQQVHADAYADVRHGVSPRMYAELVGDAPGDALAYRRDMARDAYHFVQQLPFYRVRPLYIGLLYALHHTGMSVTRAAYLVSLFSFAAVALLILAWMRRYLPMAPATAAAWLLLLTPPLLAVARTPSPDALSTAFLVAALYALIEQRRRAVLALLMLLAILVRHDNAIFALLVFAYLGLSGRHGWSLRSGLALALSSVLVYVAVNRLTGAYDWTVLFHHTFIGFLLTPSRFAGTVSAAQYIGVVQTGVRSVLDTALPVFGMLWVLALGLRRRAPLLQDLLLLIAATIALRYLLFPILWDRLLAPYYVMTVMLLVAKAAHEFAASPNAPLTAIAKRAP